MKWGIYWSIYRFNIDQTAFQGKFYGIGATVGQTKDGIRVLIVAPIAGSPAEEAGIKAGDIIMLVDGSDTEGWTVLDAVNRIRGELGSNKILDAPNYILKCWIRIVSVRWSDHIH